jgi:hypothetical protein
VAWASLRQAVGISLAMWGQYLVSGTLHSVTFRGGPRELSDTLIAGHHVIVVVRYLLWQYVAIPIYDGPKGGWFGGERIVQRALSSCDGDGGLSSMWGL